MLYKEMILRLLQEPSRLQNMCVAVAVAVGVGVGVGVCGVGGGVSVGERVSG